MFKRCGNIFGGNSIVLKQNYKLLVENDQRSKHNIKSLNFIFFVYEREPTENMPLDIDQWETRTGMVQPIGAGGF